MCLLSAESPTGSYCTCPQGLVLAESNGTECFGKLLYENHTLQLTNAILIIAPLQLIFTLATPYIRRIDLNGENVVNLYTGGAPRAIDYDYW